MPRNRNGTPSDPAGPIANVTICPEHTSDEPDFAVRWWSYTQNLPNSTSVPRIYGGNMPRNRNGIPPPPAGPFTDVTIYPEHSSSRCIPTTRPIASPFVHFTVTSSISQSLTTQRSRMARRSTINPLICFVARQSIPTYAPVAPVPEPPETKNAPSPPQQVGYAPHVPSPR